MAFKRKNRDSAEGLPASSEAASSRHPLVIADAEPADLLEIEGAKKALLAGNAVFVTADPMAQIPDGYVEQPARQGVGAIRQALGQKGLDLRISVSSKILETLTKTRLGFAIDGYLSWGFTHPKPTILIGGVASSTGTILDVLIFERGILVRKDGRVLPEAGSSLFDESLRSIVNELRDLYASHRVVMAAPLPDFGVPGVDYIGDAALRGVSYKPVSVKEKTRSYSGLRIPAFIILGALGFYGAALGFGWSKFSKAQGEYEEAIQHPSIVQSGGVDQGYLGVMQQRRIYMEQPRRQVALANKAGEIVRGIAQVPGVRIVELRLPAPYVAGEVSTSVQAQLIQPGAEQAKTAFSSDRQPDVGMTISVPSSGGQALDQARQVMEIVGRSTGMDLRLAHQGWREDKGRRVYSIEGAIRD